MLYKLYEYKSIGKKYPLRLKKRLVIRSTSIGQIKARLKKLSLNSSAEFFTIISRAYQSFYDNKGKLLHRFDFLFHNLPPFLGNDNPKFKIGDIVEVNCFSQIRLGIISEVPFTTKEVLQRKLMLDESDNVYLVDFALDRNGYMDHEHPMEFLIKYPRFKVKFSTYQKLHSLIKK